MFKNEGEYADAMRNGRVFNNGGWICKFDQDVLRDSKAYSPFVCMTGDINEECNNRWVPMDNTWKVNDEIFEIFKDNPELEVDTKVFVKDSGQNFWFKRHFKEWNGSKIVCFGQGDTSFTESDPTDTGSWDLWKIAEGKHKDETNVMGRE